MTRAAHPSFAQSEDVSPRDRIPGCNDRDLIGSLKASKNSNVIKIRRSHFAAFIIYAVLMNSLTAFLYHLTASEIFSQIGNAVAVCTFAICLMISALGTRFLVGKLLGMCLIFQLTLVYFINIQHSDIIDYIKFLEVFVIYAAARNCVGPLKIPHAAYALAALPLVLIALGGSRLPSLGGASWSYFPNRNTAALFYTCLLFALSMKSTKYKIPLQIAVCVASAKVGILIATFAALLMSGIIRFRFNTLIFSVALGVVITATSLSGIMDRQISIIENLIDGLWNTGISGIANSNYSDLYDSYGSELSGYFRIMHWTEILNYFSEGGPLRWLFGYGGGYTPKFTTTGLVPHNDYLKSLAEFGVFSFSLFVGLIIISIIGIRDRVHRTLFMIVSIYFFTENLLNSFSSMALLFGFAGLAWARPEGFQLRQNGRRKFAAALAQSTA